MKSLQKENENRNIVGIGACNMDIYGKSLLPLRAHYDHPALIGSSIGGVMYNIICNFTRIGGRGKLITAIGDDSFGLSIKGECERNQIDLSDSLSVNNSSSGVFMQIQDENNDMHMALCDMSILDHLTPEYLFEKKETLRNAALVVIDPSLREDSIERIIQLCKEKVPIYIDPISDHYALKIRKYLPFFTCIKPNRTELENLTGRKISDLDDTMDAARKLIDSGLKKILVSLGKQGVLYRDKERCIHRKLKEETHIINASGAGDALMAGLLYGEVEQMEIEETLDLALAAGIAAIRSTGTINDKMSMELLREIIKESRNEL